MNSKKIAPKQSVTNFKPILFYITTIINTIFLIVISIIIPYSGELNNANYVPIFQKYKICFFVGVWSIVYLLSLYNEGTRYFIPQNTFWILPKSKIQSILFTVKRIHTWRISIIYHILFIAPISFYSIPLSDNFPYIFIYLGTFTIYSIAVATMWHTKYNFRTLKDYFSLCQYPFTIFICANGLQHFTDLKYFIATEIAISIIITLFFYLRQYKYYN